MTVYVLPRSPSHSGSSPRRKHTISYEVKIGLVTLSFTLIGLISLLSFASLSHTSKIQAAGYQIKKLEQEKESLMNTHKSLTMEIAKRRSLATLENSDRVKAMVVVTNPIIVESHQNLALK
ncbi:MAG: hypothetical protein HY817_04425 [Candidatus Abawacabacteria bacterium]|nr:hypothetical protein [Candidatus Abawacabacteria bacterium]